MRIMELCPICSVSVKDHSSTQAIDRCKRMAATGNNDCNGTGPHSAGEVRVMPHSDTPLHGNDLLCRSCWQVALVDRRERNRTLGDFARYSLPAWETAKVYRAD